MAKSVQEEEGAKDSDTLLGKGIAPMSMDLESGKGGSETASKNVSVAGAVAGAAAVRELVVWFGTLTIASTIMTVANKAIMLKFRYANMVLLLQSLLSAAVLIGAKAFGWIEVSALCPLFCLP